jgi:uncharacterized phiE125 gp8 family phage protein
MNLKIFAKPLINPLDLAIVKKHLRIFHDDEDEIITGLIEAVTSHIDGRHGVLGRALITQTWDLILSRFPAGRDRIHIPFPPLQEVVSIFYKDTSGDVFTIPSVNYGISIGDDEALVCSANGVGWPLGVSSDPDPVTVRFKCGYGDAVTDIPPAIRQAMLLMIARLYACREDEQKKRHVMNASDALLAPWRLAEMSI